MADANSTLHNELNDPTESHLAEEYPMNCDPFSVWYSTGAGLKWAINDEEGMAIAEAANYEDAVKIANAFRAGAYRDAVKAAHELGMDTPNDKAAEYRAGAVACLDALRIIERITASSNSETSMREWWNIQDTAATSMLHAAGKHGEFMAGFVTIFAEFASIIHTTGMPDVHAWKPEATMTRKERTHRRAEFARCVEEGEKIAA